MNSCTLMSETWEPDEAEDNKLSAYYNTTKWLKNRF